MKSLGSEENFLAITDDELCSFEKSRFVIQQIPYEHTSSYLAGSSKGPAAIVEASHFVELYDEELGKETFRHGGIATLPPIEFGNLTDAAAIELIEKSTDKLLEQDKFVISLGAEHTVTLGLVKSHLKKHEDFTVLQLDAHSDLRFSYHDNIYSHASVMARVHELGLNLVQIGIRAQCVEEAELINSSNNINTFYAHYIRKNDGWMEEALACIGEKVYISIDADGFDPSVVPCVGTAEPNGLFWNETLEFLKLVSERKKIIGFDVVEVAPRQGQILSEYTLAKLVYRLIGFLVRNDRK
jgi:agmatinase